MSKFEVRTYPVTISEHPNADRLEVVHIGDYQSCVLKNIYKEGDTVAYIPEGSVVPDEIITELGLEGKLSGPDKNRVKAAKLRGVLSQGLVYGTDDPVGVDIADKLGIEKYVPPLPDSLRGNVENNFGRTIRYDIENIKKYPNVIEDGEQVRFTEKLHGTWTCIGLFDSDTVIATSKGLSSQGLSFKIDDSNKKNVYVKMWLKYQDSVREIYENYESPVYLIGETYGKIQDLRYGMDNKIDFRVFDIYRADKFTEDSIVSGHYMDPVDCFDWCKEIGVESVPIVYDGPFSKEVLLEHTRGKSCIETADHVREGIVVKPLREREDIEIGRVILKSISEDYLLRKGNKQTEFE